MEKAELSIFSDIFQFFSNRGRQYFVKDAYECKLIPNSSSWVTWTSLSTHQVTLQAIVRKDHPLEEVLLAILQQLPQYTCPRNTVVKLQAFEYVRALLAHHLTITLEFLCMAKDPAMWGQRGFCEKEKVRIVLVQHRNDVDQGGAVGPAF